MYLRRSPLAIAFFVALSLLLLVVVVVVVVVVLMFVIVLLLLFVAFISEDGEASFLLSLYL
jgi:hypothetical protein